VEGEVKIGVGIVVNAVSAEPLEGGAGGSGVGGVAVGGVGKLIGDGSVGIGEGER